MEEERLRLAAQHFANLPDPRVERTKQHPLINVVVIALCAVLAEAESFYDIEQFGQIKKGWLAQFLDLKNGILELVELNGQKSLPPQAARSITLWDSKSLGQR